jgi:hypothetical protein
MATRCDEDAGAIVEDCQRRGLVCRVSTGGAGECGYADGVAVSSYGDDCAALGLLCQEGDRCANCSLGTPCSVANTCEGDVASSDLCVAGFAAPGIDCARAGLACGDAVAAALCQGQGDAQLACAGDALEYCLGGVPREIDCRSIGFRTCGRDSEPYGAYTCLP